MPRPPKSEGATTRASTLAPSPLPNLDELRGAPQRLVTAKAAHDRATAALQDANNRRSDISEKLADAESLAATARPAAEREQSRGGQARDRSVSVVTYGERNNSGIGLQDHGVQQGVDYSAATTFPALARYDHLRENVTSLEALVARLRDETIPEARQRVEDTAEELRDAEALEAAKVQGASLALLRADAKFVAAADALEAARAEAEQVRADLVRCYGSDERFATRHLVHGLSPAIAKLAIDNVRAPAGVTAGLLDMHRNSFHSGA